MAFNENWVGKQVILIILAHPDDPEFFCGATIARWTALGHEVHYLLFTKGDKGSSDPVMTGQELSCIREKEQRAAADVLGVKTITYLDKLDGYVTADLDTRRELVKHIRLKEPSIIVSCDPQNLFSREGHINHPDHRSVGQQVVDAIFPGVGNPLFFKELFDQGINTCKIRELWLSIPAEANTVIDVTEYWSLKISALAKHKSQIGDEQSLMDRMQKRRHPQSKSDNPRFEEKFRRIIFK